MAAQQTVRSEEHHADAQSSLLIIDSDSSRRENLRMILSTAGFAVTAAKSYSDANAGPGQTIPTLLILGLDQASPQDSLPDSKPEHFSHIPYIVCVSSESGTIVKEEATKGAIGCLVHPMHAHQIVATLSVALERAKDLLLYQQDHVNLVTALENSRSINIAVGLIMERNHIDQSDAFHAIRARARSNRKSVLEVSNELIDAFGQISIFAP